MPPLLWDRLATTGKDWQDDRNPDWVFEQFISIFTSQLLQESDIFMRPDSLSDMEDREEDREVDT